MTPYRLGGVLLAAATLLATVLAGSASADHPWSALTLTVSPTHGAASTVYLRCRPAGGSHPNPEAACRAVADAHGDFDNLPHSPQFVACTMEYRPVIASARGSWHGHPVRWQHTFANPCTLRADTGVVFAF